MVSRAASRKAKAHSRPKVLLAILSHQDNVAFKDIDELILPAMTVEER